MLQSSSSGISLQLAPSADAGGSMPQKYSLREQTDNITPTVVFADLQGRLSARLAACRCMQARTLHCCLWMSCRFII